MATRLIKDHHSLTRNMKLNGNYISNDGGDEGISISDTGLVAVGTETDTQAQFYVSRDVTETAASNYWGQKLDIERSGNQTTGSAYVSGLRFNATSDASTGGATNMFGMYGDVTGQLAADSGSMYVHGMRIDVEGHTNGSGYAMGLKLSVEGSSSNTGIALYVEDGGNDIRNYSSANVSDYFHLDTGAYGKTTILTNDQTSGTSNDGHIQFEAEGSVIVKKTFATTSADTWTALSVDFDKSGSSTTDNTMHGLNIDIDNITATDGENTMYGIYCTPRLYHAADAGEPTVIGGYFKALGDGNGTSVSCGIRIDQSYQADTNLGLQIRADQDEGDYFSISTLIGGVTTIATVDDNNNEAAHLTFDILGDTIFKGDIADGTSTEVFRLDSSASSLLMASSKKIELGASQEYIYGDGTDIHIGVGSSGDINIPADIGLTFGDDGEKIEGDGTNLTIASSNNLTITTGGDCVIDRDTALTATGTARGLSIDYDHTGISASGQTVTGIGLDLDMNCSNVTHVGTVQQTAIDIDMVAATDGVQVNTGLAIDISGGDKAFGLTIDTNVGSGVASTGIYLDNLNGGTDFKSVSSADVSDYFTINTIAAGATTLATVDETVGATGHFKLTIDGNIILGCTPGGAITLQENDTTTYTPSASSDATTKAYVDTGDNTQYHFIKCGFYNAGTALIYIPLAAAEDMREVTGSTGAGERVVMICPFDGSVETIWVRSEATPGSTIMGMHVGTGNTETPGVAQQSVTVDMSVDDTSYEFDFAGAGTNTFSKGNILMFSVNPTTALYDVHFMMVLKFDVST